MQDPGLFPRLRTRRAKRQGRGALQWCFGGMRGAKAYSKHTIRKYCIIWKTMGEHLKSENLQNPQLQSECKAYRSVSFVMLHATRHLARTPCIEARLPDHCRIGERLRQIVRC